jgi:septum formation protein
MKHVILASGSPRRREILASVGLKFDIITSDFEEDNTINLPPRELVEHLSLGKARWVAERHPNSIVIAADTLVFLTTRLSVNRETRQNSRR